MTTRADALTTKADGEHIAGDPTPGPWKAEWTFVTADAERIPGVRVKKNIANTNVSSIGSEAEMFANARLIAAAPEMYAALEHLTKAVRYYWGVPACNDARAGATHPKYFDTRIAAAMRALSLARGVKQ